MRGRVGTGSDLFSHCLGKKHLLLRRKGYLAHSWRLWSILPGNSWLQGPEAVGTCIQAGRREMSADGVLSLKVLHTLSV